MQPGKVTQDHQVTIPQDVRDALGLKAGDQLRFEVRGDEVVLTKRDRAQLEAEWLAENREAIESWNKWVEENGIPYAEYRQF